MIGVGRWGCVPSGLGQGRDAVLGERADAAGGGDAHLGDLFDAARDAGDLARDDVVALGGVALDGRAVATDDALQAGAGLLGVALELVAGLHATALVAALELLELTLGRLAGAEGVDDRRRGLEHAVTRLERRADVGQRRALGQRADLTAGDTGRALLGLDGLAGLVLGLRADATTRRGARARRAGRARRSGAAGGRLALTSSRLLGGRGLRLAGRRGLGLAGGGVGGLRHECPRSRI